MWIKPNDEQAYLLADIKREVINCHYYSEGPLYCSRILNISPVAVHRIAHKIRVEKISMYLAQGLSDSEISIAMGITVQKAKRYVKAHIDGFNLGD